MGRPHKKGAFIVLEQPRGGGESPEPHKKCYETGKKDQPLRSRVGGTQTYLVGPL